VSSALIAFGFVLQTPHPAPFIAGVLPALWLLGEFTFAALLRNSAENVVLTRHMQRIREYYRQLVPDAHDLFVPPEADRIFAAAMATVGLRAPGAQMLFTGASTITAVNAILGGVAVALLVTRLGLRLAAAVVTAGVLGVLLFVVHVAYEQRFLGRLD
jgi:hypothetical protein